MPPATAKNVTVIPPKSQEKLGNIPSRKKLRVAAYCRVSSDKDEQLNSFEVQVKHYTDVITKNPNWKMAGIFADEGISGVSMKKRDNFLRMLRHCREGRIDMILVKSVSRFGRNTVDIMNTIRKLKEQNVTVVFEKENLDTSTMSNELMLAFFSAFAQSELESLRENIIGGNASGCHSAGQTELGENRLRPAGVFRVLYSPWRWGCLHVQPGGCGLHHAGNSR